MNLDDLSDDDLAQRARDYGLEVGKDATRVDVEAAFRAYYDDLQRQMHEGMRQDRANSASQGRIDGRHEPNA